MAVVKWFSESIHLNLLDAVLGIVDLMNMSVFPQWECGDLVFLSRKPEMINVCISLKVLWIFGLSREKTQFHVKLRSIFSATFQKIHRYESYVKHKIRCHYWFDTYWYGDWNEYKWYKFRNIKHTENEFKKSLIWKIEWQKFIYSLKNRIHLGIKNVISIKEWSYNRAWQNG